MPIDRIIAAGEKIQIRQPSLVNLYGCEIGSNTKIAAFVEIGEGVVIGKNCKIEAFSYIPKGVVIEDDVFIGPHVCFTNNRKPQLPNDGFEVVPTLVKKGAMIGANSSILCGVTIGENAVIGMGSVVITDVFDGYTWVGNPAGGVPSGQSG